MRLVVSGATKGIGRSIAETFAANGFDLAICSRNQAELDQFSSHLEIKFGIQVLAKATDVSVKNQVIEFADFIKESWNKIDVLVNNAGTYQAGLIHQEDDGVLELMMNTNLHSAYHLSRSIIPLMKTQKSGHIFNITSIAGIQYCENTGAYGISKYAMTGFNNALREELKTFGIKVTSIIPGATKTASWDGEDFDENRLIPANDIASLVWSAYNLSKQTVVEEIVVRPLLGDV